MSGTFVLIGWPVAPSLFTVVVESFALLPLSDPEDDVEPQAPPPTAPATIATRAARAHLLSRCWKFMIDSFALGAQYTPNRAAATLATAAIARNAQGAIRANGPRWRPCTADGVFDTIASRAAPVGWVSVTDCEAMVTDCMLAAPVRFALVTDREQPATACTASVAACERAVTICACAVTDREHCDTVSEHAVQISERV
jgi:hypothetical protein